ncbi:MAG: hypothetical protein EPN57_18335 [Paraburkholderia sp.]|nr:MAG: hypothetical protein EPN57_18335 [Paraburkholderia sp.]
MTINSNDEQKAKNSALIRDLALVGIYPSEAAIAAGHPDSHVSAATIETAVRLVQQLGGTVLQHPIVPGNPAMGTHLLVYDLDGNVVPNRVHVF